MLAVKIISVEPHPDARKLKICTVDTGKEKVQVVCGATNVRQNMHTILAPVGSKLPSGKAIEKASLRGVESNGMLCSAKDLEISKETGIIDLPEDIKEGTSLSKIDEIYLSSIPWHTYKLTESYYEDASNKRIFVVRAPDTAPKDVKLLSQTYFHEGSYHYRHFTK